MSRNNASQTGENKAATIQKNEPLVLAELSLHAVAVLFDPLPEAVVLADRGRRILYINAAAEALFGYSLAPLRNKKNRDALRRPERFCRSGQRAL